MNKTCRIINGKRVCKKVSYNPLKMWGAWVGAVLISIFAQFFGFKDFFFIISGKLCLGFFYSLDVYYPNYSWFPSWMGINCFMEEI